ncbi:hypothetical protein K438DRAFT_1925249 [Mycena galopus ATCC 62051]|nr:hypothetical protein K438DRAFT_1925249 [Mycena galopus ATCC 62051]
MRFSLTTATVFATFFAGLVGANPTPTSHRAFNPDPSVLRNSEYVPSPRSAPSLPLTNAKRLQLGLPLKQPTRRYTAKAAIAKRSAIPSAIPPASITASILVNNASGSALGYLNPQLNAFGEYGYVNDSLSGALSVTFSYDPTSPSAIFDVTANNGVDANFPFFGAIVGYASTSNDLGPGSSNYNYLGATWSYDPVTALLTPQWTNTNGSIVAASMLYDATNVTFLMTGDIDAFTKFDVNATIVTFSLVTI